MYTFIIHMENYTFSERFTYFKKEKNCNTNSKWTPIWMPTV